MSDTSFGPNYRPRQLGNTWSLKKIVEEVTGKPLSSFQEMPRMDRARPVEHEPEIMNPPIQSFLAPPEHVQHTQVKSIPAPIARRRLTYLKAPAKGERRPSARERERKYLAYLMLHLDALPDPALKYLRQAVEEELKDRRRSP